MTRGNAAGTRKTHGLSVSPEFYPELTWRSEVEADGGWMWRATLFVQRKERIADIARVLAAAALDASRPM